MRRIGGLLTMIGAISTGVLIYNWVTGRPIPSILMLGVLVLLLGMALTRRPSEPLEGGSAGSLTPPSRKKAKAHKSWISRQ